MQPTPLTFDGAAEADAGRPIACILCLLFVACAQALTIFKAYPDIYMPPLLAFFLNREIARYMGLTTHRAFTPYLSTNAVCILFCFLGWAAGCIWAFNAFGT